MRQEDKAIPTRAPVASISSVRSAAQGERDGAVAGGLEGDEVPCRRWEKAARRKAGEGLWAGLCIQTQVPGLQRNFCHPLPGDFHFPSFSLKISIVGLVCPEL